MNNFEKMNNFDKNEQFLKLAKLAILIQNFGK